MQFQNRSQTTALQPTVEQLESRRLCAVNPTVVDVAVYYTPAARNSVGGVENLSHRLDRAIADTNVILANSRIDATVRLVWFGETSYKESGTLATDLGRLQNPADGYLDAVHAQRTSRGADLVHLLVADGDDGGRAYQLDDPSKSWSEFGFAVSQARYTNIEYIFAHETMHNSGAGHDDTDTGKRQIPYAYGLGVKTGTQTVHTLMGPGTRLPYLSSPDLSWRGQPLGIAAGSTQAARLGHAADNARVVREFLPRVAAHRSTFVTDATPPAARLIQSWVDSSGKTLSIQVALADDSAINVSTLGNTDLRITGPNGFSKAATFAAVDRATNGSQRLARYKVDLTGYPADPALYTATLNSGQIADIGGRTVAGGTLGLSGGVTRFGDRAGPNLQTSLELGAVDGMSRVITDGIGDVDPLNFYRFSLKTAGTITARLAGLSDNANLFLVKDTDANGEVDSGEMLASSTNAGTSVEQVSRSLSAGVYYLWVTPAGGAVTNYTLSLKATAAGPGSPPSQPPPTVNGSIRGLAWRDNNANGVQDSWEIGLSGWSVYADVNGNGVYDSADARATTDSTGAYTLTSLPPANYTVRSIDQSGYRRTTPASTSVAVAAGQSVIGINFGHTPRVLISGVVYTDTNRNQVRDAAETGQGGWTVYRDANNNSRFDAGESASVTDASGYWSIKDALPGTFVVRLIARPGYSSAPGGWTLDLTSGQTSTGRNFGVRAGA
ncbi:SdrD B-like domain-containing protein [Humisphaera borealis]|uniref:SD-repeat containing protein B domain-containing protein n=1 Tax=Humisphaera borealis TaxID=2807512 RepID=A0A7M2WYP5_9BACT|nr:SdrD B-like domain-containing protein [Humisphaera borealis]QOV90484.1 hypothetical protein IPV69_03710 [Humisphaera borealis]